MVEELRYVQIGSSECLRYLWALLSSVQYVFFMLSIKPLCSIVFLPFSAILTNLSLFVFHASNTTGLPFTVYLFVICLYLCLFNLICGRYVPGGPHTAAVLHHGLYYFTVTVFYNKFLSSFFSKCVIFCLEVTTDTPVLIKGSVCHSNGVDLKVYWLGVAALCLWF